MSQKSEIAKMSERVTRRIVANVSNVLGILPPPLAFELPRPRRARRRRARKASARPRSVKRARTALTRARKAAGRRMAPRRRRTAKVIPLKRGARRTHHTRAA